MNPSTQPNNSFSQSLANATNQIEQPQSTQPTVDANPSWFEKLIPTAGGILGGLVGTLVDPFTGGMGTVLGAGIGGSLGKGAEDVMSGQTKNVPGDMIGSGVENAIGQGVGGLVGKAAGAVLGKAGNLASGAVPKLIQGQATKGALDGDTAQFLANNGVLNLNHLEKIAPTVTQADGALSSAVRNTLLDAGEAGAKVDLSDIAAINENTPGALVKTAASDAGIGSLQDAPMKNVLAKVQGTLEKYNQDAMSQIPAKGGNTMTMFDNGVLQNQNPLDVFNMTQEFDRTANQWLKSSSDNVRMQGVALQNLSAGLKSRLYGEGSDVANFGISDRVKQDAIDALAPLQQSHPQLYQNLVGNVQNATNLAELRTAQAPIVRAAQALGTTNNKLDATGDIQVANAVKGAGSLAAGASQGGVKGGVVALGARALQTPAAQRTGTSVLSKMADVLSNPTLNKIVTKAGGPLGVTVANGPNYVNPPTSPLDSTQPQGATMQSSPTSALEAVLSSQSPALVPMQQALGDSQFLQVGQKDPAADAQFAQQAMLAQKTRDALNQLSTVEQAYQQAGGAQGPVMGLLAKLGGAMTGGPAANYENQAAQLQATIQALTGQHVNMPSLMQNQQAANDSQAQLNALLGGY